MKKLFAYVTMMLLMPTAIFTQEARNRLNEGIYQEEVVGDLKAAIDIYNELLDGAQNDREASALALFHLGIAHEKLGKQQAATYFRQVLQRFPEQPEIVDLARARLARYQADEEQHFESQRRDVLTSTRLATLDNIYGNVSPNGRYISFVDWSDGNMAMYDISRSEVVKLTDEGSWAPPTQFGDGSVWSPDNDELAYLWILGDNDNRSDLRIFNIENNEWRSLTGLVKDEFYWPFQWNATAGILALLERRQNIPVKLVLIDPANGSIRTLQDYSDKALGSESIRGSSISPDGQYFCVTVQTPEGIVANIYSTRDSEDGPISTIPYVHTSPIWSADGQYIVYSKKFSETPSLYRRHISHGVVESKEEMVLDVIGQRFDLSNVNPRTGDVYYLSDIVKSSIEMVSLDMDEHNFENSKTVVTLDGELWSPTISPNGHFLAFYDRRGVEDFDSRIVIRDLRTGEQRDLDTDISDARNFGLPSVHARLNWTSDSRHLKFDYHDYADGAVNRKSVAIVDINTGKVTRKLPARYEAYGNRALAKSNDEIILYNPKRGILKYDYSTDEEIMLYKPSVEDNEIWQLSLSHDGNKLAFHETSKIDPFTVSSLHILNLNSGEIISSLQPPDGEVFMYGFVPQWFPDNTHLMVGTLKGHDETVMQCYSVDLDSGNFSVFGEEVEGVRKGLRQPCLSRDGKHMVYVNSIMQSAAWEVKNIQ